MILFAAFLILTIAFKGRCKNRVAIILLNSIFVIAFLYGIAFLYYPQIEKIKLQLNKNKEYTEEWFIGVSQTTHYMRSRLPLLIYPMTYFVLMNLPSRRKRG